MEEAKERLVKEGYSSEKYSLKQLRGLYIP
jgi:hypothetical protein